jgi:hypothetical protein
MNLKILFRKGRELMDETELSFASKYFECLSQRSLVKQDDFVVCRYSCLPYYKELETDVKNVGGKLISTHQQHLYTANVSSWFLDLKGITPETYFDYSSIPDDSGPLVVKGSTNSKKFSWRTHMFAENKRAATDVAWRLEQDAVVGYQDIVYRTYVPLRQYFESLSGYPVTEEYRFFVCHSTILCGAFYWSNHLEDIIDAGFEAPNIGNVPKEFLAEAIKRIGSKNNFYTLDVGRTQEGKWIVIEINDGQMSGLSENDPDELYKKLHSLLSERYLNED